ncbi:hypothetical protein C8J57DRAFT_1241934 [Mycena rebaudengoi]|nr:hypothetical protein C8J57DRAFT_1241934 [Mycena rebaudengoi]
MTLRLLLTSFRTPRLRVLYFTGRHFGIDTVALSECTELLSTVARLVLFVGDDGIGLYSRLFIALPQLRELELRSREGYVLGSFIAAGRTLTGDNVTRVNCPLLAVIGSTASRPLISFDKEAECVPIERVCFRRPIYGDNYLEAMEWMEEKGMEVSVGTVAQSVQTWKGANHELPSLHASIKWNPRMGPRIPEPVQYDNWRSTAASSSSKTKAKGMAKEIAVPQAKRKNGPDSDANKGNTLKKTMSNTAALVLHDKRAPLGLCWDNSNYSCAYDSVFGILFNIWTDDPVSRSQQLRLLLPELATLVRGFQSSDF